MTRKITGISIILLLIIVIGIGISIAKANTRLSQLEGLDRRHGLDLNALNLNHLDDVYQPSLVAGLHLRSGFKSVDGYGLASTRTVSKLDTLNDAPDANVDLTRLRGDLKLHVPDA